MIMIYTVLFPIIIKSRVSSLTSKIVASEAADVGANPTLLKLIYLFN